jgi:hypothetical protein
MKHGSTGSRAGFAAAVALFAAGFVLLALPWLTGAVTIPWDAKAQFQPELQFLATSLADHELPFWTPNVFAGWPQIADPQSLIFSPLHLVLAALDATPSFHAADMITFAYLFAGGLGMILFFRDRNWHAGGAVVAALILAFGASAYSRLQHTSEIVSLSYMPIALWLMARTLERGSWRAGLAAGMVIGLIIIGRDQVAMLGLYILALYTVAWCLDAPAPLARIRQSFVPLAACAVTAAALATVPLSFSALLAAQSNRPMITFAHAGGGSLHPALLLMLAFADLFGAADPNVEFWGPPSLDWSAAMGPTGIALAQNMGEIYCGILAILLLAAGLSRGMLWGRDIRFFPPALALTLVYALGWYTPLFRLIYATVPGVDLFRRPADATFIIGFLMAVIAGYVVHRVLSGTASWRWFPALEYIFVAVLAATGIAVVVKVGRLPVAVLPIVTGLGFAGGAIMLLAVLRRVAPARPWLATVLVAAFVTGDLAWNNAPNESTGLPPQRYEALRPQGSDETVALIKKKLAETAGADRRDRVELIGIAYHWPNVALAQGFDHLFGHNPLRLGDFARATGVGDTVAEAAQRTFAPLFPSYRSTFADLCGVRFIVTGVPVENIDKHLKPGDLNLIARTPIAYVYENPRALPRVMLVQDYRLVDFDGLIRHGWPNDANPRRTVLLERAPAAGISAATGTTSLADHRESADGPPAAAERESGDDAPASGATYGAAQIVHYGNTDVDIAVEAPRGGFLVLNDAWHPWWRADVDGRPADILKADVLFRAVAVTPGLHHVHFRFEPFRGAFDEFWNKDAQS